MLISCWGDGAAAQYLPAVRALFPHVEIQAKGLLATEGCVTFPICGQTAPALAIRSHFFEFQEDGGHCRLAHELERGGRYRVVLTTGGGLYRYPLGDEVEVIGWMYQCPLLRFRGRAGRLSDQVGEKLSEVHVGAVFARVFRDLGLSPAFALLAPVVGQPPCYRLYIQQPGLADDPMQQHLLQVALQSGLEQNPHYRYAVQLEQLGPVQVQVMGANQSGWQLYERACLERGMRAGNIKPAALDGWTGWPAVFESAVERSSDQTPSVSLPVPAPSL